MSCCKMCLYSKYTVEDTQICVSCSLLTLDLKIKYSDIIKRNCKVQICKKCNEPCHEGQCVGCELRRIMVEVPPKPNPIENPSHPE